MALVPTAARRTLSTDPLLEPIQTTIKDRPAKLPYCPWRNYTATYGEEE